MKVVELTPEEDVVLLGWAREMVLSDGVTSRTEHERLQELRFQLGGARYDRAHDAAARRYPTRASLREAAKSVVRPEARRAIYALLESLAASDGVAPEEDRPLRWLAAWWHIESR